MSTLFQKNRNLTSEEDEILRSFSRELSQVVQSKQKANHAEIQDIAEAFAQLLQSSQRRTKKK